MHSRTIDTAPSALDRLRDATAYLHRRLDSHFDAAQAFADPVRYAVLRGRYAALLRSATAALAPRLAALPDLDFHARLRARGPLEEAEAGSFPLPQSKAEAMGMFYVLEGSTLGGRIIRRSIEASGSTVFPLTFLDPYGDSAGQRWRSFLAVLDRELRDEAAIVQACRGAVATFLHVERVLCGDKP